MHKQKAQWWHWGIAVVFMGAVCWGLALRSSQEQPLSSMPTAESGPNAANRVMEPDELGGALPQRGTRANTAESP